MALGLAMMFGIHLPENFNRPYASRSITEFWRRWHMSLSRWFRDYLYIPLGGNRGSPRQTYRNLVIVFLIVGLWHGAAWTFVLWGAFHGVLLLIERATGIGRGDDVDRGRQLVGQARTIALVLFGWILFRSPDLPYAIGFMEALLRPAGGLTLDVALALDPLAVIALAARSLDRAAATGLGDRHPPRAERDARHAPAAARRRRCRVPGIGGVPRGGRFQPVPVLSVLMPDPIPPRSSRWDRLVVVAFVAVLAVPGLAMIAGLRPPELENRADASLPTLDAQALTEPGTYQAIDDYVARSLPARDVAVSAYATLDYGLLRGSTDPDVVLGRDEWLFFIGELMPKCPVTPAALMSQLDAIAGQAERAGIEFRFAIAPDKHTIYPDRLRPDMPIPVACTDTGRDEVRAGMAARPDITVDMWTAVLAERDRATSAAVLLAGFALDRDRRDARDRGPGGVPGAGSLGPRRDHDRWHEPLPDGAGAHHGQAGRRDRPALRGPPDGHGRAHRAADERGPRERP